MCDINRSSDRFIYLYLNFCGSTDYAVFEDAQIVLQSDIYITYFLQEFMSKTDPHNLRFPD